jgi:heme/copper-type cytochrome/quinol oxidase subunit 2
MKTGGVRVMAAVVLGIFAIIMAFAAALALMDIAKGKEDSLVLEWLAVWIALVVIVVSQFVSIAMMIGLWRARRRLEEPTATMADGG